MNNLEWYNTLLLTGGLQEIFEELDKRSEVENTHSGNRRLYAMLGASYPVDLYRSYNVCKLNEMSTLITAELLSVINCNRYTSDPADILGAVLHCKDNVPSNMIQYVLGMIRIESNWKLLYRDWIHLDNVNIRMINANTPLRFEWSRSRINYTAWEMSSALENTMQFVDFSGKYKTFNNADVAKKYVKELNTFFKIRGMFLGNRMAGTYLDGDTLPVDIGKSPNYMCKAARKEIGDIKNLMSLIHQCYELGTIRTKDLSMFKNDAKTGYEWVRQYYPEARNNRSEENLFNFYDAVIVTAEGYKPHTCKGKDKYKEIYRLTKRNPNSLVFVSPEYYDDPEFWGISSADFRAEAVKLKNPMITYDREIFDTLYSRRKNE